MALINSKIINGGTNKQTIGLLAGDHVYLLGSEISGFGVGLEAYDYGFRLNTVRVFDSDLSQNDIGKKTSFALFIILLLLPAGVLDNKSLTRRAQQNLY